MDAFWIFALIFYFTILNLDDEVKITASLHCCGDVKISFNMKTRVSSFI